jgi:hypothetical protein
MTVDLRISKREVFVVEIGGNQILLPASETSFELIKTLVSSPVYNQSYTATAGTMYYKYGDAVSISLREVTIFNDPNADRQYEAIRQWDDACIEAKNKD